MKRADLSRVAAGARIIAAVLLLFVALRLVGVGIVRVLDTGRSEPAVAASVLRRAPSRPSAPSSAALVALDAALPPAEPKPKPELGRPLRVPLIVTAGPNRAEVFVNKVKVGNSPFVGDVSCRSGDTVRIDILPSRGMPVTHERSCIPGTLRVE